MLYGNLQILWTQHKYNDLYPELIAIDVQIFSSQWKHWFSATEGLLATHYERISPPHIFGLVNEHGCF